ncbi:aconitase family protein [Pseudomonas sp. UBA4194]|uniref:cis-3-hydroxy-L-proline dehydratase n=1 Tax=Pseudomonas sp. UBA4194 TaxID=1947317 RepID=UPI0025F3C184|nr:aconitase family protein [Pseudomonas sp. UBA4194]
MASICAHHQGRSLIGGAAQGTLIFADTGLSFWGGVDPATGQVIDQHHPLHGRQLSGQLLAIPSGRGSCTGSSVMMELISQGRAPAALILAEPDEILTLGVLVARYFFERSLPVLCVGPQLFAQLASYGWARVVDDRLELYRDEPEGLEPMPPALADLAFESTLKLSPFDHSLLEGQHGKGAQVAMQIVTRMAELQGARELVDVSQAHIDGCIYTGPASLQFAEQWVQWGARVRVPTTLNAISVDQRRWRELGVDPALGDPASALGDAYMAMGAQMSFTCAPYLLDTAPSLGEHVVWAESNAVAYANSVLGARTQKYADYLDICIALTGRAPLAGCHVDDQRQPRLGFTVTRPAAADDSFYPLLGYHIGALCGSRIPLIFGLEQQCPSLDDLKAFSAAFATTSAAPMFHLAGVTPHARDLEASAHTRIGLPMRDVQPADLLHSWHELNSAREAQVDVVTLGNPHFSLSEFARLAAMCAGRRKHPDVVLAITCGRTILEQARQQGHVAVLERFGATLITDTCWCMLGEPVIPPAARVLMTNSGKYAHYAPGLVGRSVHFGSLADCVAAACTGQTPMQSPPWLPRN